MLLSIGMMIKNEEKHLKKCLESLMPLLDNIESELVIIDTGSTDNSVNIAKSFTNKVFLHSWDDNFSDMRNKVISYCTGEWIMVIDGDEILENPSGIIDFFKLNDSKKFNTALLMVKNLTDEKTLSSFSLLSSPRLFKKDKDFHYEGAVHNQPIFKKPIIKLESTLIHYGYISSDIELMERKFIRTVSLLKKELEKDSLNFYYWCQLSVSYSMHGENEKALEFSIKAYEVLKSCRPRLGDYIYVYIQHAFILLMNREYKKAIDICLEGISLRTGILDLHYYLATAQMAVKDYEGAIKNFKEYLNIADNIEKFIDTSVSMYTLGKYQHANSNLVTCFKEIQDFKNAFEYCKKITDDMLIIQNLPNTIYLSLKNKYYDYLYEYYNINIVRLSLQSIFETILENNQKVLLLEERNKVAKVLGNIDVLYGVLNRVRYSIVQNEDLNFELNDYLESNVDFNDIPDYYGDLLYYLIIHKADICKFLKNIREIDFNRFFIYLKDKYDNFGEIIFTYVQESKFSESKSSYRIRKALERYCILSTELKYEDFIKIFDQYIMDGTTYIKMLYSEEIILNEDIYDLKNEEEGFLLYIVKAISTKVANKELYIRYLRKALNVYPYMKRGIEYLLKEFNTEENEVYNELEQYKIQVKNTIKSLIQNNKLEDAKAIITEYEEIIKDDMEIILFKSQIALDGIYGNNKGYKM